MNDIKSIIQTNDSSHNNKSYYDYNGTQYICMGVKPYYSENYYQCSPFDYYYNCLRDPCFRCNSVVVPTGTIQPGSVPPVVPPEPVPPVVPPGPVPPIVPPGPVPPVVPPGPVPPIVPPGPVPPIVPPAPAILGSAAFQSNENLDIDQAFDLNVIFNDGIVRQISALSISLLPHKRYSYNFEIEANVPSGSIFNVGGDLEIDGIALQGSLVTTNVEQRPGVAIAVGAGILEPVPNNRPLKLFFISDIGPLDVRMRLNIDEIALLDEKP